MTGLVGFVPTVGPALSSALNVAGVLVGSDISGSANGVAQNAVVAAVKDDASPVIDALKAAKNAGVTAVTAVGFCVYLSVGYPCSPSRPSKSERWCQTFSKITGAHLSNGSLKFR